MEKVLRADLPALVKGVLHTLPQKKDRAVLLMLKGDLGAGKTTFTQALAKELGVTDIVQSPTYVLMKKYDISKNVIIPNLYTLVHLDLYRLENPEQFAALKPQDFLNDPHALVCVEWPERVGEALRAPDMTLTFSSEGAGENERSIEISR